MKGKFITSLLITTSLVLSGGYTTMATADDDDGRRYWGIPFFIKYLNGKIEQNADAIDTNRADIQDLDLRVMDLELAPPNGGSNGGRNEVIVDCTTDANALLPPQTEYFPANTTYQIKGVCNGPLFVTQDRVYFEGVDGTNAAIVQPDVFDPDIETGAIFANGVHDLQISNLEIDGYVLIDSMNSANIADSTINGALEISNHSIVKLESVDLEDAEVEVGTNSTLNIEDGTIYGPLYINNNSIVELESVELFQSEILVETNSTLTMDGGTIFGPLEVNYNSMVELESVDLFNSDVAVETNSTLQIEGGNIQGEITVETNSILNWNEGEQSDGGVNISENATLSIGGVELGEVEAERGAVLGMEDGSIEGLDMSNNTVVQLEGTEMYGDISLTEPAHLNYPSGDLQGNFIYLCGNTTSTIDTEVEDSGTVLDTCADDL